MSTLVLSLVLSFIRLHSGESAWNTDYAEAIRLVREHDKPLFIVFESGKSDVGHAVQTGLFMNEQIERALTDDYVRLFVDTETEPGRELAADFGVAEIPRVVIIDRSGDWQVYRKSGAHSPDELLTILGRFRRTKMLSGTGVSNLGGYTISNGTIMNGSFSSGSSTPTTASSCKT
jgi:thioredoxin-related protein